jgi:hypothetical protein
VPQPQVEIINTLIAVEVPERCACLPVPALPMKEVSTINVAILIAIAVQTQ